MEICKKDKCTGCYACVNVCPKECITMQCDEYGELHPVVDKAKCIECNLCVKSCPNNYELEFRLPKHCYASWITDTKKRKLCASGGVGTMMSEYVINHENGVVYGTRYDDELNPVTTSAETAAELEAFKGSKYVHSSVGQSYKEIKSHLKGRRMVLYIATPCQIAGLYSYLKRDYDNLITVDLICHGVNPSSYLKDEIDYLKKRKNFKNVTNCRFRTNDRNDFSLTLWDKEKLLYKSRAYHQPYFCGFTMGVTMRENCYTCNYARPERVSDITIGDFIGLGKLESFNYNVKNTSSVFLNTDKAVYFYSKILKAESGYISIERKLEERLIYKPSLIHPFERHELASVFRENYIEYGFVKASRMTLRKILIINKIKNILTIPQRAIRKIYRMIKSRLRN